MIKRRMAYWLGSSEREAALREEMELHMEEAAEELRGQGMSVADARAEARRRFGNVGVAQEDARGVWIARWWTDFWRDVRYGARGLRRDKGFTAVAALSAALGIGACTTVFSIVNFALFRPLPVAEPERLMSITGLKRGSPGGAMSYPEIEDLRRGSRAWAGVAGYVPFVPAGVSAGEGAMRHWGYLVTANYFDVVRPAFALGRGFQAGEDDRSGAPAKIVLSHRLWRAVFGADAGIVGRTVQVNKRAMTVVGVTGEGFRGTETGIAAEFYLPLSQLAEMSTIKTVENRERLTQYTSQWLSAVGRLSAGVTPALAQGEMDRVSDEIRNRVPNRPPGPRFHASKAGQIHPMLRRLALPLFGLLLGVTLLVLMTACANLANLMLARGAARQNELATRMAIGAGRGRMVRQLLTESLLVALLGGGLGAGLAAWAGELIGSYRLPLPMPVDLTPGVDYRVMAFAAGLALLTGVAFGLVPALRLTRRARLVVGRYEEAPLASLRRFGMRNALVVAQIAMSTVLVVCSGLFLRSLRAAERIDSGMNPRNVALVQFDPGLSRYDGERASRLMLDLLSDVEALPGVKSASLANMLPLSLASSTNRVRAEGAGAVEGDQAAILAVGPGYFKTAGMRLLAGQDFRPGPMTEAVGVVNEELARRLYPGQDPVGRRLSNAGRTVRIIGVASNAKYRMLQETEPVPTLYEPILDTYETNGASGGVTLMARCDGDPAALGEAIRQRMRARDADLAVNSVSTMEAHVREALFLPRLAATLFGMCGAIGLVIASIGVYGVISFAVSRRRKEIGIRMALGGQTRTVVLMVMRHGMALTVCGVTAGMMGALVLARLAGDLAKGVSVSDPLTFGLAAAALGATGVLATAIPARRAARVDPNVALRAE